MKKVIFTRRALKDLKRHSNVAARIRKAIDEYATDPKAHANNVTELVGSTGKRMRAGDYRVIFEDPDTTILVTKVGPRGDVYE